MKGKPEPLVSVYQRSKDMWEWQCSRCYQGAWDRSWKVSFKYGHEHALKHTDVGFQPPKR